MMQVSLRGCWSLRWAHMPYCRNALPRLICKIRMMMSVREILYFRMFAEVSYVEISQIQVSTAVLSILLQEWMELIVAIERYEAQAQLFKANDIVS